MLRSYEADGGARLADRYGEEARTIAADMAALVRARLLDDTPYESLWQEFHDDPDAASAEFNGALEALVEADPGLTRRLNDLLERYRRATMSPTAPADMLLEEENREVNLEEQVDAQEEDPESLAVTGDSRHRTGEFEQGAYLYGDTMSGRETIGSEVHSEENLAQEEHRS
ncbi:MAG: hypothetical protein R2844_12695 [Caldilineales bacterium]